MTMTSQTREQLHRLVDELPDAELRAAWRFLSYLRDVAQDPVRQALLDAPYDDEPETPEEAAAVQEAREEFARGEGIPDDEFWRGLDDDPAR